MKVVFYMFKSIFYNYAKKEKGIPHICEIIM